MFGLSPRKTSASLRSALAACTVLLLAGTASAAGPSATLSSKASEAKSMLATATSKGKVRVIVTLAMPASVASASSGGDAALKASVKAVVDPFVTQTLGVASARAATADTLPNAAVSATASAAATPSSNVRVMPFLPMVVADLSAADLERVAADGRVRSIHPDEINRVDLAQSVPLIGGDSALSAGASGAGRMVAIMDTGIQYLHPFFGSRVVYATCHSTTGSGYTTLCPNGQASQYGGNAGVNCTGNSDCVHGTHVAGIAAGNLAGNNPPRGVAPQATIFSLQVFSRGGDGSIGAFSSDMIAAMQDVYARRSTLNIAALNISLGGGGTTTFCNSDPRAAAMDQLRAGGVAVVVSSGNDGYVDGVSEPACVASAITVGSSTKSDVISSFSNMATMVDLMAPGSSIRSSLPTSTYGALSGTSMAAPHVAGAIAALKSAVPTATIDQMETALKSTGVAIVDNRSGGTLTKPRINVYLALLRLRGQALPPVNDRFSQAINVVPAALDPTAVTGTNDGATLQTAEPRGNSGVQATVWWKFVAQRREIVRISTWGSNFDTTLGVYTGTAIQSMTPIAFNDDSGTSSTSLVEFQTQPDVTYYVQVGGFGTARGAVKLTFSHPTPTNDNFTSAQTLLSSSGLLQVTSNNTFATLQTGEPKFISQVNRTIWYKYKPAVTRAYAFNTLNSTFDTTLAIYRGTALNALTLVAANDDNEDQNGARSSRISTILTAGVTYYIQLGGYGQARGATVLQYRPSGPANDMIAAAKLLAGSPGVQTGTNEDATVEPGETLPFAGTQGTAWWRFTATQSKTMEISTAGSDFDTTLAAFVAGGAGGLTLVASNDDDGGNLTSRIRFSVVSGRTYYVQVGGYGTSRGSIRLSFPTGATPLSTQLSMR